MLKYETFYGDISANRKIYVHSNKGTANGSCELLEDWLEKNGYMLVSMLQPDPVRVPHKVNIVVSKFDYTKLDYASAEIRVASLLHGEDRERRNMSRESTRYNNRTKPSGNGKMYVLRVIKDDFIKLETKPYSKQSADRVAEELTGRFLDCKVCRVLVK